MRLQALWLLRKGEYLYQVAAVVGCYPQTVQDWVAWYRKGGLEEVMKHREEKRWSAEGGAIGGAQAKGGRRVVSAGARCGGVGQRALSSDVHLFRDVYALSTSWAAQESPSPGSSEGFPGRTGSLEKRGLGEALKAIGACRDQVYWSDEMRVGLLGQVRRVWGLRGVKVVQRVEFERKWTYLNLAVNVVKGTLPWDWSENMTSETLASVLKRWEEKGVKVVVWDRAAGYHGKAYAGVQVRRMEQPSYSPQLNPVERVFEYLRSQIEGKVYGSQEAKRAAVEEELKKLANDPEKVKRLTGWKWILEALDGIQNTASG